MREIKTHTDLSNLNKKQLEAVMSEDKRLLVLAGAGSGKTKTLIQKLEYLIKDKGVKTSEILAITFTKNATNEMVDRLIMAADSSGEYSALFDTKRKSDQIKKDRFKYLKKYSWVNNVAISTFHSLCYKMMKDWGTKGTLNNFNDNNFRLLLDSSSVSEDLNTLTAEETRANVLGKILIDSCNDKDFLIDFKKYILDYYVDRIDFVEKKKQFTYEKPYTSLNGTRVSSKSEQFIADWLYRHNIKFVYEPLVNIKEFEFEPDFFIPEANLYLEHVSDLSAPTKGKAKELFEGGKELYYTYESQTKDTAFFNLVLERAIKGRLPLDYHYDSDLNYEEEFKFYHKEVNDFRRQVLSAMDMIKVENYDLSDIAKRASKNAHERVRKFYEFAIPLIEKYKSYCVNKSYQDFNDLILSAVDLLKNNRTIRESVSSRYKFILVDEFQDVNNLQVELLSLLLNDDTQLFCVGDDWQSIYGFRGSNVDYIVNFEQHYPKSSTIKLDMNYRSTPNIVGASNEVIKQNKFRVDKNVQAFKEGNSAIHVFEGESENENIAYAVKQVQKLIDQGYAKEDILFLYRRSKMYTPYFEAFKKLGLFVSNKTIHASKGLEAKAVFILGLTEGKGGFPDVWLSDAIFQAIKETEHDLLLEEERRLYYVALTRAKDHLFLMSQKDNPSRFINEIPRKYKLEPNSEAQEVFKIFQCECGNSVEETDNFCSSCGRKLSLDKTPADQSQSFSVKDEKDLILECIADLPFEVGVNYLSDILKGSKSVLTRGNKEEDFVNFGQLADMQKREIKELVNNLIDSGVVGLYKAKSGYNKVCLTKDLKDRINEVQMSSSLSSSFSDNSNNQVENKIQTEKSGNWIKEEAQKKHRNAYEPWSIEDDNKLKVQYCEGKSIKELAIIFKRSEGAIIARIEKLE